MQKYAVLLLFGLMGCITTQNATVTNCPPAKSATFDFSPPLDEPKVKSPATFLLVHPRFDGVNQSHGVVKNFIEGLRLDIVEMVTARGYNYKGPIDHIGNVVYSDKRDSDLLLEIEVDLQLSTPNVQSKTDYIPFVNTSTTKYFFRGTGYLSGKVNMIFSEPFTGTKLQVKSIPIEPTSFTYDSCQSYDNSGGPNTDPAIWNALISAFGTAYSNIVSTAWKHLDPEEIEYLRNQSKEIRKESVKARN